MVTCRLVPIAAGHTGELPRGGPGSIHVPRPAWRVHRSVIVHFVILEPASHRGRHAVRLPLIVGRSREAKFRIQQDRVSRRHCEFFASDGIVHLRDLSSRNGTLLSGVRLPADVPTRVPPGAPVRVGSIEFMVEYDALAETPTVDFTPPPPGAVAETLAARDIEIRGLSHDVPTAASGPTSPGPGEERKTDGGADDPLGSFLEGLG